jgi:hypothetical protein
VNPAVKRNPLATTPCENADCAIAHNTDAANAHMKFAARLGRMSRPFQGALVKS